MTSMIASVAAEVAQRGCTTTAMMKKTPSTPAELQRSPSLNSQDKDNCSTLGSTAATTATVVKAEVKAAVMMNKETW